MFLFTRRLHSVLYNMNDANLEIVNNAIIINKIKLIILFRVGAFGCQFLTKLPINAKFNTKYGENIYKKCLGQTVVSNIENVITITRMNTKAIVELTVISTPEAHVNAVAKLRFVANVNHY
jgi:hypothetical protein